MTLVPSFGAACVDPFLTVLGVDWSRQHGGGRLLAKYIPWLDNAVEIRTCFLVHYISIGLYEKHHRTSSGPSRELRTNINLSNACDRSEW